MCGIRRAWICCIRDNWEGVECLRASRSPKTTKDPVTQTGLGNLDHARPWLHSYVQAWLPITTKGQKTFSFDDKTIKCCICYMLCKRCQVTMVAMPYENAKVTQNIQDAVSVCQLECNSGSQLCLGCGSF